MTGEAKAPVLTATRAPQHIRLFETYDACKRLYALTVPPSLAPSPRYAGRYTVSSRFWCHSCECGYIVRGLRTVCCLAAPTSWATRNGMRGLVDPPCQTIISSSFTGRSVRWDARSNQVHLL